MAKLPCRLQTDNIDAIQIFRIGAWFLREDEMAFAPGVLCGT
jgi:hypothetical protein